MRPKTIALYEYVFTRWIMPRLGASPLVTLSRERCRDFFAGLLAEGFAPNTVQLVRGALSACLSDALEVGVLTAHPLAGFRFRGRAQPVRPKRVYDNAELTLFLATASRTQPALAPLFSLCGKAGLRPGEAQAIRTDDLDWRTRRVRVTRTAHVRGEIGPTKTGASRHVDLPASTCAMLGLHEGARDGWCFPAQRRGGPIAFQTVYAIMHRIADAARLPRTSPHALRHSAASVMLQLGLPLVFIQRQLGHASIRTTEIYSGHLVLPRPAALDDW